MGVAAAGAAAAAAAVALGAGFSVGDCVHAAAISAMSATRKPLDTIVRFIEDLLGYASIAGCTSACA